MTKKIDDEYLKGIMNKVSPPTTAPGKEILTAEFTWDGRRIRQDLNVDLEIEQSPKALNDALASQPGRVAWWGMLEVRLKKTLKTLERDLKFKKAELFIATKAANDKLNLDSIKAAVEVHPEIERLERAIIEAEADLDSVGVAREAVKQRKDSLMTISANMRAEMDSGLSGLSTKERARQFFHPEKK